MTTAQPMMRNSLPADTHVGLVSLTIADLDRSVRFYRDTLGFDLLDRSDGIAVLGSATAPLVELFERRGAQPKPPGATGLYHFAVLLPTRRDLGRTVRHLLDIDYPLDGAADHLVSEAIYLTDPDGNGIELYRDRPPR
ncbi:MAG: glyoxalase [Dehalococcoidia bacterium]|nr:MAG: glyoxalase [Dehalococcoidia bacterium]